MFLLSFRFMAKEWNTERKTQGVGTAQATLKEHPPVRKTPNESVHKPYVHIAQTYKPAGPDELGNAWRWKSYKQVTNQ